MNFQRRQFQNGLSEAQAKHYEESLASIIDRNFRQNPSAGFAFARMTGGLFEEVRRNDEHLAKLLHVDIPFQLIWGGLDPYLNSGVAEDLVSKLKKASLVMLAAGHWPQVDEPHWLREPCWKLF